MFLWVARRPLPPGAAGTRGSRISAGRYQKRSYLPDLRFFTSCRFATRTKYRPGHPSDHGATISTNLLILRPFLRAGAFFGPAGTPGPTALLSARAVQMVKNYDNHHNPVLAMKQALPVNSRQAPRPTGKRFVHDAHRRIFYPKPCR